MKALITGITGQDGYFLAKLLLSKNYEVYGIARRKSNMSLGTLDCDETLKRSVNILWGDVLDNPFIESTIKQVKPDEVYHLAAQSFVGYSFENPEVTYDVNIKGTLHVLNSIKDYSKSTRLYNATTSEMFGKPQVTPQNEKTPFFPRSPYAISKLAAYWTVADYREAYGMFAVNGILFNHESEVRGPEFVTKKISLGVAKIYHGSHDPIVLGNLDAKKDWGYARDYVEAMWMMLQQDKPDDYVIGTGEQHTVREFVEEAFKVIGMTIRWKGEGVNEVGVSEDGRVLVKVDLRLFRPLESDNYMADYTKARIKLGWEPAVKFKELVKIMVEHDIKNLSQNHCFKRY